MNVLVVGSGGREHALCRSLKKASGKPKIYCAPGNAGIAEIAECVKINAIDVERLKQFALEKKIDLTVVGGETSLDAGIVDEFEKVGLRIVGASQKSARLESSKAFAKDFMARHNIPTARFKVANSANEAFDILRGGAFGGADSPVVVKADGLAAGKGVVVACNRAEAENAIREMMIENSLGNRAANRIVLEETLAGREVSLLLFADGKNFALMPPARDHKRIGENDTGANTGGMGTFTDNSLLNEKQIETIVREIVEPTLEGAAAENFPFRGILFLGLMMTEAGAKLLEYNVRFGDPEAQSILIRLESDLVEICNAIVEGRLGETKVKFSDGASACVVMAAKGYPAKPETGAIIRGLENAKKHENVEIFHAGTDRNENGEFVTAGGRVLGVTAAEKNLDAALKSAYNAVKEIVWDGVQFRRDIGGGMKN
jgi:phosphoribosylamine---glycine ligase